MNVWLASLLLLAQTISRMPGAVVPPNAERDPLDIVAEVQPEVLVRGKTTTVTVSVPDPSILETLKVQPADGVTLGRHGAPYRRDDGLFAVTVPVTIAAAAAAGERQITIDVAAETAVGAAQGATSEQQKAIAEAARMMAQRGGGVQPIGSFHVNGHAISLVDVSFVSGSPGVRVRFSIADAINDLDPESDAIEAQLACGETRHDVLIKAPFVVQRNPNDYYAVSATADVERGVATAGCDFRVRVRDVAGNLSSWLTMPYEPKQ